MKSSPPRSGWKSHDTVEDIDGNEEDLISLAVNQGELETDSMYNKSLVDDAARAAKGTAIGGRKMHLRMLDAQFTRAAGEAETKRQVALEAEARHSVEEGKATELVAKCKAAEGDLAKLEAWLDSQPLGPTAQPKDKMKELDRLTTAAQVAREMASAQLATVERERHLYLHAVHEADKAERELHASAEVRKHLTPEVRAQNTSELNSSVLTNKLEEASARVMETDHAARAAQRERARMGLDDKARQQVDATVAARAQAKYRANKIVREAVPAIKEVLRMKDEAHNQRVESVLQLKADTEAAAARIRGQNERQAQQRESLRKSQMAEKAQLEAKGLNPHKVFKQREVEARVRQEEANQEQRIQMRKEELQERLRKEVDLISKKDAHYKMERELEHRYMKELGKHVTDTHNRDYLRSRTIDGSDTIDPSGQLFRIEPSQVTTMKDGAFGLGFHPRKNKDMAKSVVQLVASKPEHAGVGPGEFRRLIPKEPHPPHDPTQGQGQGGSEGAANITTSASSASLLKTLAPPDTEEGLLGAGIDFVDTGKGGELMAGFGAGGIEGGEEGHGSKRLVVAREGMRGAERVPSKGEQDNGAGGGTGGKGRSRGLSAFEVKALSAARERQRVRMEEGEPQVAGGKVFQGRPSFVAKPAEFLFKDFSLGKVHRRRVLLTNVSLTFNAFKVLELPNDVKHFFGVSYSKPGRISAGMSCAIDIVFTPKVNEDIFSELPIRSQTGSFTIPINCMARKSAPSLSTEVVSFQQTVLGEKKVARIRIDNNGALPTRFSIVDPAPPPDTEEGLPVDFTPQGPKPTSNASGGASEGGKVQGDCSREGTADKNEHEASAKAQGDPNGPRFDDGPKPDNSEEASVNASDSSPDGLPRTEPELLLRAARVGTASLQYPPGGGALMVKGGGEMKGYSSSELTVTFAPLSEGEFRTAKVIRFEGSEKEFHLDIQARGVAVPVSVGEPVVDMRCCVVGKLYIKKVRVYNRGKIAMKALAKVPPVLRGCCSFSPDMGFVQPGGGFFDFGMRFRPSKDLLRRCIEEGWGVGADLGVIGVPVRIQVPEQAIPVFWTLRAQLTESKVEIGGLSRPDPTLGDSLRAAATTQCGSSKGEGSGTGGHGSLDFGRCFTDQSVIRRISLRNTARIPLKYGFVGNPQEVTVQPNDGFGILLPFEERWLDVKFSPVSAVLHDFVLNFRTSLAQSSSIRCRGIGVEPVLSLSHSNIQFVPACPGDTVTASVFLHNVSRTRQSFELVSPEPDLSFLKVSPAVANLAPGEGSRIEVKFSPPVDLESRPSPLGPPPNKSISHPRVEQGSHLSGGSNEDITGQEELKLSAMASAMTGEMGQAGDVEPVSEAPTVPMYAGRIDVGGGRGVRDWTVVPGSQGSVWGQANEQSVVGGDGELQEGKNEMPQQADGAEEADVGVGLLERAGMGEERESGAEAEGDMEPWGWHGSWRIPCFIKDAAGQREQSALPPPFAIEVKTVTVRRVLSLDRERIDFGQLAVGGKAEVTLRVINLGTEVAPLVAEGLNSTGPYQVLNALRPVQPGGTYRATLQFSPQRQGIVSETLILNSPSLGKTLRVRLRGEGVSPVLRLDPPDGRVDLGHVLEGDVVERSVVVHNDSAFHLRYKAVPFGPRPPENLNHIEVLSLVPPEGGVPPGGSVEVKALFCPDHARLMPHIAAFRVEVPNQSQEHIIRLRGRCIGRQVYVEAATPDWDQRGRQHEGTEDPFSLSMCMKEGGWGLGADPKDGGAMTGDAAGTANSLEVEPAMAPPILLRFPKNPELVGGKPGSGSAAGNTMAFVVGSLSPNDAKKSSSATFEIELSAEAKEKGYFRLVPDKGTVTAGGKVEVLCTFDRPEPEGSLSGRNEDSLFEMGQWYKTLVLVHIKGGFRPPGSLEINTVQIQLEGFLRV